MKTHQKATLSGFQTETEDGVFNSFLCFVGKVQCEGLKFKSFGLRDGGVPQATIYLGGVHNSVQHARLLPVFNALTRL